MKNATPGKYTGPIGLVKKENKLFMINGPSMAVRLMMLVKAPCKSPCTLEGSKPAKVD